MKKEPLPTIALIPNDVVGERMAGPGVRYWEFARVLGRHFPVKLIIPPFVPMDSVPSLVLSTVEGPALSTVEGTETLPASLHICTRSRDMRSLVESCDVIVTLGGVLLFHPFLGQLDKPLVLDMYDPFLLAGLQREAGSDWSKQITLHERYLEILRSQLYAGDFFLCASEKQRDYLLGTLSAMGRVNPHTCRQDPTLRRLIDIVPFGLPARPPQHTRPVLKGVYKTIAADDKVILWGGGIWNWFDAPTLIKAMPLILQVRADVKLFFMGINRPNRNVARMEAADQAIALSQNLGLYERCVFFNDWVPYEERQNYLLEADIGVSLHLDHVETRFAFRTRLLDYLWAGLPIVSTGGSMMGESLAAQGLAYLVAPGDVEGVARTSLNLLSNPTLRADHAARFRKVAANYHWDVVARPLIDFCASPALAPDKDYLRQRRLVSDVTQQSAWRRLLLKSRRALQLDGVSGLLEQGREYIRWKMK